MELKIVPAYEYREDIRELFTEYTMMLAEGDPQIRGYLAIQHYEDELADLEMKYGMPDGRLYIVICHGRAAGCIGLRRMDAQKCEMKRLYVRPEFRGHHIGEQLIRQVIKDAKEIGYSYMYLDTLPFLQSAIHMYRMSGFYEIEQYNDSPMESTIFMRLDL